MIRSFISRLLRIMDSIQTDGLFHFLKERIWINRKAVIIEKDLLAPGSNKKILYNPKMVFEEITINTMNSKHYQFAVKNRYLKSLQYLHQGYGGHILVKGNEVIGDIWYSATSREDSIPVHPDIRRFGIDSSADTAYSFDQYVAPTARGNNVAAALLGGQANALREKGYARVRGYYWADNLPAVWNARVMNKFRELKVMRVYRILFFEKKFINRATESRPQKNDGEAAALK